MGNEWDDRAPVVSNLGQPAHPPTDYEVAAARKIDDALDEGERNRRMLADAERLWRVAFTEVEQRALALHELAGLDGQQQVDELRSLQALVTVALGRWQVLQTRKRDGLGLYRQMTGNQLPPYDPERAQLRRDASELPWRFCGDNEPHVSHNNNGEFCRGRAL